jgi:hypothetical protein
VANMGAQGPMYDNLIRRDPRDGKRSSPIWPINGTSLRTVQSIPSTCARSQVP